MSGVTLLVIDLLELLLAVTLAVRDGDVVDEGELVSDVVGLNEDDTETVAAFDGETDGLIERVVVLLALTLAPTVPVTLLETALVKVMEEDIDGLPVTLAEDVAEEELVEDAV